MRSSVRIRPDQPPTDVSRWFGIDTIASPRLFTWAVKAVRLKNLVEDAAREGVHLGPVAVGSRKRSDGVMLRWEFTDPATVVGDGLVPFIIDCQDSPHLAASASGGPVLVALRGEHPTPAVILYGLAVLVIHLPVEPSPRPALTAMLRTAHGIEELR